MFYEYTFSTDTFLAVLEDIVFAFQIPESLSAVEFLGTPSLPASDSSLLQVLMIIYMSVFI